MSVTALFITAFMVGLSGAMMPGSMLTAVISQSAQRGFWIGPLIVLGHAILEFLLIVALLAGLSSLITKPMVSMVVALVGGAFLIYLGYITVRDTLAGRVSIDAEAAAGNHGRLMNPVPVGILVSLSNPYWSIWWATIGLSYLTLAMKNGSIGVASFYCGHISADLLWYSVVAGLIAGGKRFINQKVYNAVLLICGLFLAGLGVYFIYSGIKFL